MSAPTPNAPNSPPKLSYTSKTYLTVSSPPTSLPFSPPIAPSSAISTQSTDQAHISGPLRATLAYVGPVGALSHEHLYSLDVPTQDPVPAAVQEVKQWLEQREGVAGVQVMSVKPRVGKKWEG
jgi:hypothetical protein